MQLIDAIQITKRSKIAIVGAGGKSTSMFRLAKEWQGNSIVSTSTHLALSQIKLADHHFTINNISDLKVLEEKMPEGITALTGPLLENNRVDGLSEEIFIEVARLAHKHGVPLLIEADGSRRLPLKAPATHEPPIPSIVNTVIVVVGLAGLGKKLSEKNVHRPELYGQIAGMEMGEEIKTSHLLNVLQDEEGGLKNIPDNSHKILIINQADTSKLIISGSQLAKKLIGIYDEVFVCSLEDPNKEVAAKYHRIAGIVLAAGGSKRLGEPKQLLDWEGKPFVRAVVLNALEAGLDPVIVITGAASKETTAAIEDLPVTVLENYNWQEGQSTSLKVGLEALPSNIGGVVFLLVDQPQIPTTLIKKLIETHVSSKEGIIATMVDGRRGNPVLFDRWTFPDLLEIGGDKGGRQVFSKYKIQFVPWVDPFVGLDVDSPEDYQKLLNYLSKN